MTREDIIRMAQEANRYANNQTSDGYEWNFIRDERFAALVADRMIRNGYRKCAEGQRTTQFCGQLESAVAGAYAAGAAAEREACAKVCDDKAKETFSGQCQVWGDYFARVIRARGNT